MFRRLKTELRSAYNFYVRLHKQGYSTPQIIFCQAPHVIISRLYAKLALQINGRVLNLTLNPSLIQRFHKQHSDKLGNHFYLIVMPGVLHFIVPCLHLIPKQVSVFLLFNGAKKWEIQYLKQHFPEISGLQLKTLPRSCLSHGDVLTLLLKTNKNNFGLFDHDLYIFDDTVFNKLEFAHDECMLAIFPNQNEKTGLVYPLTHFLFFNVSIFQSLMHQHKINANLYKNAPPRLQEELDRIGLTKGTYMKSYHNYFDTLHLLLAIAFTKNLKVGYIDQKEGAYAIHVGGTSMGGYLTKDLPEIYERLRFLEFINDPYLNKKYAYLYMRFKNAAEIAPLIPKTPMTMQMFVTLDRLINQLQMKRDSVDNKQKINADTQPPD